jgi:trimethylamine--corrinoid protein Co-methyltransferase
MIRAARARSAPLLSPVELSTLHAAGLRILEEVGVEVPLASGRLDALRDLGVMVEGSRLRFPPALVEEACARAPRRYALCGRDPGLDLDLGGEHSYLCLDGSATEILDLDSGSPRPSTRADLEAAIRIADGLPQIALLWPCVSAGDAPPALQPLCELEVLLTGSRKHAQAMTVVTPEHARAAIAMAALVAGGRDALRARPILSSFQCSVSPLAYDEKAIEAAILFAEAGVPCGFWSMTIGGGTAPVTVAGNAALVHAEVLAGIAILELLVPGAATFYGTSATMMELRRGGVACGGPEDLWLAAAGAGLAHRAHVPASIGTFATGAKACGFQAGLENALSGAVSLLAGAELWPGAGLLASARLFSLEQLLLDAELFDYLRVFAEGPRLDAEALALEAIAAVGPRGHFLGEDHTLRHMRAVFQPRLLDRSPWDDWLAAGRPGAAERARAEVRRLLAAPSPDPPPFAGELRALVDEEARRFER